MPVFSLTSASQENAEAGKQYNFLTEGYTQCYMQGYRARIKNLEKGLRTGNLTCCWAPCMHALNLDSTHSCKYRWMAYLQVNRSASI